MKSKVRLLVRTLEGQLKAVLFKYDEISMDEFSHDLIEIFEGSVNQAEARLFSRYLFEPRVYREVEETNRLEKSKFIETRLRKFVGQYDVVHDNSIENIKEYFSDSENTRTEFLARLDELKHWKFITPFELMSIVSDLKLSLDVHQLCILLCRKSLSITKIKGDVIEEFLIPALKYKIEREVKMIKIEHLAAGSQYNKYSIETPFEEMDVEQQEKHKEQFLLKLADFLFSTRMTIQLIMNPKIFDRVIDGAEYRYIKHKHFIRLIKRAGLSLSYNDEMCIKSLIHSSLVGSLDITKLEQVLSKLGIEDEKPVSTKHLNFSKLTGSSIRIFNKINHDMNENEIDDVCVFLGKHNLDLVEVVARDKAETVEAITPIKLRDVLRQKGIINYGQDLDDDFIDFVSVGDDEIIIMRKFK